MLRNLTKGYSNEYQYLVAQEFTMGRKMGRDLAFSPDGNTIALFAKRERGRSLVLVDVLKRQARAHDRHGGRAAARARRSVPDGRTRRLLRQPAAAASTSSSIDLESRRGRAT